MISGGTRMQQFFGRGRRTLHGDQLGLATATPTGAAKLMAPRETLVAFVATGGTVANQRFGLGCQSSCCRFAATPLLVDLYANTDRLARKTVSSLHKMIANGRLQARGQQRCSDRGTVFALVPAGRWTKTLILIAT
jgi:hypothetical protein